MRLSNNQTGVTKNCSPTHVGEQPQHKHKIKHDKTTMQFFSLLYVLSNITTTSQVFTYPRGVSGYLHL
ncbi:hypothetical protein D3Z46_02950 [Bacteroides sartorii]|uniref:Uncharacterized protein n=1 Tax=Phocaeicola sartorii TaxID=671267 RepID=A0A4S2FPQ9_9BACT|nr:hypothetical protein [Phocaeicola sartorii]TGY71105.1 hypothetical protein E5339_07690 [Phocaeicola sartorii]